jgi:hypothetical protein
MMIIAVIVPTLGPQGIQKIFHLLFSCRAATRSGYGDSMNPV